MPSRALALLSALISLAIIPASAAAAPKKVAFKFSATTYSVPENAGTFNVTVLRTGNTSTAATVAYSDSGTGTAAGGGTDYSVTGGTLSFAKGETSKSFPVTIVDNDTANAPNKTIVLRLSNASPAGSQIKTTTTALTIIDNEGPGTLDFSSGSYTVLEGAGAATVTVNRAGASNLKLSVDYATQAAVGNPATATSDYTPISPARTLTFNPGEMSKTFQVAIADDSTAEGPENVALLLSNPKNLTNPAAVPQVGPNSPAELAINDDDASTFAFSSSNYTVREDAGPATITVKRSGATNLPASVTYATVPGGTASNADYTPVSGTLAFAAGEMTKTFDVAITNDGTAEANETVNLTLAIGGSTVATSLLSIVDNDNTKASVQLASPVYEVDESDGMATVTVTLSHTVDADVTVAYATADGSATGGADYGDTSGTLTFLGNVNTGGAGQTSKTIQIPILQDGDAEDPETLTLALSNALPGTSSVLGAPLSTMITIADDDPPGAIDFKSLSYDVNETGSVAVVTVQRVGGAGGAVSVDYQTSDGSATAGDDYTTTGGTLSWGAGDRADKTFLVPIKWDGRAEGTEAVSLTLANIGGGADAGPNSAAVIRIADDGASGPLALTANAYRTGEADGVVTIDVKRSGGSLGGPVTVDYATSDGTATAGEDYDAVAGTLTFAAGEAAKSVAIQVTSDTAQEDDETLQLKLSNATGGANLGSPAGATVTIADDDAPAITPTPTPTATPSTTPTTDPPASDPTPAGSGPAPVADQTPIPVMSDKTAPKLTVSGKKVQRALKAKLLALKARCDEGCKLVAVAKVRIGKKTVTLGRAKLAARSGTTAKLKVKLTKKALGTLRRATTRGKARVVVSVRATDAAGNGTAKSRKVAVKR